MIKVKVMKKILKKKLKYNCTFRTYVLQLNTKKYKNKFDSIIQNIFN